MTLNPSTMRLGIASILVGLVGAYGVRHMMEEEVVPVEETKEKVFQVPLASGNLPAGRVIRKGDIGFSPMTRKTIDERGWQLTELMMNERQIIGRELKRPLAAGSPFLTSEVHLDGDGSEYTVTPGMRAVQVRISEDRGGGQAYRGDTVDLFFTSTPQAAVHGKPAIPEKTLQVTEAVQILDVDYPKLAEIHWAVGYKAKSPIFTLEVDPDTAGKITTLKDYGDFAVLVRSSDEPSGRSKGDGEYTVLGLLGIDEPVPPQQPPVWQVEKYGGRSRSVQYFPLPQPTPDQLAAQQPQNFAPRQPVQDVLPDAPAPSPTPAAQPKNSEPQVPFRPSPSPSVVAPTPATPSFDPPLPPASPGNGKQDPFKDDPGPAFGAGEVIP